jgi:hypothetical protein
MLKDGETSGTDGGERGALVADAPEITPPAIVDGW